MDNLAEVKSKPTFLEWLKNVCKTRVQKNTTNIVFIALSVVALLFFMCVRFVWAFGTTNLSPFLILFVVAIPVTIVARNFKIPFWAYAIGCFCAIAGFFLALLMFALNILDAPHAWNLFVEMLPLIFAIGVSVGGYYFIKHFKKKAIAGLIVIAVVVSCTFCMVYGIAPIYLKTGPVVFDAGDSYVVEFLTNVDGLGFVEIEGEEQIRFAVQDGRKITDTTIHKVEIPKDELHGKRYRVGAVHNLIATKNKNWWGATTYGKWQMFKRISTDDVKYLAASDIHTQFFGAVNIADAVPDLDFIVILGDSISFIQTRNDVENILIKGMADMSKGKIPVYYVRGNHETMGSCPEILKEYIVTPTGEYYYTFSYHNFQAIVLDSGDANPYGTTRDQVGSFQPFLDKQTKWLSELATSLDTTSFALNSLMIHIPIDTGDNDLKATFRNDWLPQLNALNLTYSISGHTHNYKFSLPNTVDGVDFNFHRIETGGKGSVLYTYTATVVTMNNSTVTLTRYNEKGQSFGTPDIINY